MKHRLLPLFPPLLLLLAWWLIAVSWPPMMNSLRRTRPELVSKLPDLTFVSDPVSAVSAGLQMLINENLAEHTAITVGRSLGSFACASMLGLLLGWVLARRARFERTVLPTVEAIRSLPPVALMPVFIIVVGIGEAFSISFSTFGCMWPITIATYAAVKGVDNVSIKTGKNLNLTQWQLNRHVIAPLALPAVLTGLRIALPLALILVIVAEMFVGGGTGLGAQLDYAKRSFRFDDMMAVVLLIGVVGFALNAILAAVERRVLWWDIRYRSSVHSL